MKERTGNNPPIYLYHLTINSRLDVIKESGLKAERKYVYDEEDLEEAIEVLREDEDFTDKEIQEIIKTDDFRLYNALEDINARMYARNFLGGIFPFHRNSIFFTKTKDDLGDIGKSPLLRVRADRIDRCREANMDHSNTIFNVVANEDIVNLDNIIESYRDSIRLLDDKPNDYNTEVFCQFDITPELIEVKTNDESWSWLK